MKALPLFAFIFFGVVARLPAQDNDTTDYYFYDSIQTEAVDSVYYEDDISSVAPNDSLRVGRRAFTPGTLEELRNDPDLSYEQPPTIAESLWTRFWRWVGELLNFALDKAVTTNWGRVIAYVIGLALIIVVVMMMLKVNAFKVLYAGQGASQKYQIVEENIHEMDFDQLLQDALKAQDYRRGVRLLFLYSLKLLADRQLVHWEMGKTNHDYSKELAKSELRAGFNELSFYFEYAWYGNFMINHEIFLKAQTVFSDWKSKLR